MHSPQAAFWAGMRAFLPILLGVVPFALIVGVLTIDNLAFDEALLMTLAIYSGSAQLVAMQLLSSNTPALVIILTTLVVNLRFLMYSASLEPYLQARSWRAKLAAAFLLTDQSYAISISRFQQQPDAPYRYWYYLGSGLMMWLTWQIGTLIGMLLGTQLPASWQLDFTIPLTFIALVVPQIRTKQLLWVAIVAGLVAALTAWLPFKLGVIVSVLAAIAAGLIWEARSR